MSLIFPFCAPIRGRVVWSHDELNTPSPPKHLNSTHLTSSNWQRYKSAGQDTVVLAGADYGSGSARDWAAKAPMLLVS